MPFELTAPKLLWALGLIAPLVVLYILKVKRQRLRIASTWLWAQAQRDLMARSPFKRLVLQVPLLVQALALILLALAAAGPATRGKTLSGDHVAIVIDTSASMGAQDAASGERRIDLAKRTARDLISALPPGSDAMILDAGRDPRVALPPDRDIRRMKAVVDGMEARDVEGDLVAAVSLAVSRLQQQGGSRRVLVITDGNLAHPAPLASTAVPIEVIRVGEPLDNAAIVRVDVRAGTDPVLDREQVQAFLMVANFGRSARELYVTMRQRNASDVLASRKVVVEPGQKLPVVLTFNPAEGDYGTGLVFDIAPHDGLPVDDVAFGRVPAGRKLPVYVAAAESEVSPWLLRALVADEDAEVFEGTVAELTSGAKVPAGALVVFQGACPASPPGGDVLVIDPPPGECFGTVVGEEVKRPVITSWEHGDPRLRFLGFEGVVVGEARLLEPESKRQALIRTDRGAIATDISTAARSATLLGFDPATTNWPRFPSFVVFVRNLMDQARHHRSTGISGPATAGDPLRAAVPPVVREVKVEPPKGEPTTVPVREGLAVVPDVQDVGLYLLSWQDPQPGSMWVPVNLVSAAESDLRSEPEDLTGSTVEMVAADEAVQARQTWSWLLAVAALGFVCFDVWWLTRRPRALRRARRRDRVAEEARS